MSNEAVFIEVPNRTLSFGERLRASLQTLGVFLRDQRASSLVLLVIFAALLVWDFQTLDFSDVSPRGDLRDKLAQWFPFMEAFLNATWKLDSAESWRGTIAQLMVGLYVLNTSIYIADRSPAFAGRQVVGIIGLFFRCLGILLLMLLPLAVGFVVLIIPGLVALSIFTAATTITVFQDQPPMTALRSSFRLIRDGLGDRPRIWGFRPAFFHIAGMLLLETVLVLIVSFVDFGVYSFATRWYPEGALSLLQASRVTTDLITYAFGIVTDIFILRLFTESLTGVKESDPA